MAVQGPVGFRTVRWDEREQLFRSPVKQDFKWGKRNYEECVKCEIHPDEHVLNPSENEDGITQAMIDNELAAKTLHYDNGMGGSIIRLKNTEVWIEYKEEIPAFDCKCGLFCTLDIDEASGYTGMHDGALLLCEGGGKIVLHEQGFRAREVTYLAIIRRGKDGNAKDYNHNEFYSPEFMDAIASDYFQIPIISRSAALEATLLQWQTFDIEVPKVLMNTIQEMVEG